MLYYGVITIVILLMLENANQHYSCNDNILGTLNSTWIFK